MATSSTTATPEPVALRRPYRFSADEYQAMGTAGIFHPEERLELIRGYILPMSPIGHRHVNCLIQLNRLMVRRTDPHALVSIQSSIRLGDDSEPEPDLVLLAPKSDYAVRLPRATDVLLLIEVADSTVRFDREVKLPLYAQAGIPETWIVNLDAGHLEVYRRPGPKGYAESLTLQPGDSVEIEALPEAGALAVEDLIGGK